MESQLTQLPVIDWDAALKLAGNRRALAEEMIAYLLKSLPDDVDSIKHLHQMSDWDAMQKQVHKLHGAVCYCGLPRLKFVLSHLETDLKNHIMVSLPSLLDQLDIEVTLLLEQRNKALLT